MLTPSTVARRAAFTLIELLVVISIIALLIGILLPALGAARETARLSQCASNQRQIAIALNAYATDERDKFPAHNFAGIEWYERDVIGDYLPGDIEPGVDTILGGVMACPSEDEAGRSYAMNLFGSGAWYGAATRKDSGGLPDETQAVPGSGSSAPRSFVRLWDLNSGPVSNLILTSETFPVNVVDGQWVSPSTIGGWAGVIGTRNGPAQLLTGAIPGGRTIGGSVTGPERSQIPARYGLPPRGASELNWLNHGTVTRSLEVDGGRVNISFADGHVSTFQPRDLTTNPNEADNLSELVALWTPDDDRIQE
ncbi:MAG: DUF1559 domain-containing protein [Planctomycetota bacterium]